MDRNGKTTVAELAATMKMTREVQLAVDLLPFIDPADHPFIFEVARSGNPADLEMLEMQLMPLQHQLLQIARIRQFIETINQRGTRS